MAANYKVVALRATGEPTQIERIFEGAPSEARLAQAFRGRGPRYNYDLAIRYYPSRKGWMIIDLRRASPATNYKQSITYWRGMRRSERVYPNESAAVMKALYIMHPPGQTELAL